MHRSIWFEHVAQSTESRIWIGEMVENPSTHDLIEGHPKVAYTLDGKLVYLKIFQVMFFLEFLSAPHTGSAAVDACNLSRRPA